MLVAIVMIMLLFVFSLPFVVIGIPAGGALFLGAIVTGCSVVWAIKDSIPK